MATDAVTALRLKGGGETPGYLPPPCRSGTNYELKNGSSADTGVNSPPTIVTQTSAITSSSLAFVSGRH